MRRLQQQPSQRDVKLIVYRSMHTCLEHNVATYNWPALYGVIQYSRAEKARLLQPLYEAAVAKTHLWAPVHSLEARAVFYFRVTAHSKVH